MLATIEQIAYLNDMAKRADLLKMRHPSLIPQGLMKETYELGLNSEYAGLLIQMYRSILDKAHSTLYGRKKAKRVEDDLPL